MQAVSLAKRISNKFKSLVELEGDPVSEAEYLAEHDDKQELGRGNIEKIKERTRGMIRSADALIVATEDYKKELLSRGEVFLGEKKEITVLPTGFNETNFFFDRSLRRSARADLGLNDRYVVIYLGNIRYKWQNFPLTLKFFEQLKNVRPDLRPFLVLLTPLHDVEAARAAVRRYGFLDCDVMTTNVLHEDVNRYLNAADLGVVIRDDHPMNSRATTAKLGEYLAVGLDVVATTHIGFYSDILLQSGFSNVVNIRRVLDKRLAENLRRLSAPDRELRSSWAHSSFSARAFAQHYAEFLTGL